MREAATGKAEDQVGRAVRVFWENEGEWFQGRIDEYDPEVGYHILYNDGDEEWLAELQGVEFEDEDEGGREDPQYQERQESENEDGEREDIEELELGNGNTLRSLSVSPVSSPKRSPRRYEEDYKDDYDGMMNGDTHEETKSVHMAEDLNLSRNASVRDSNDLGFQSSLHSTNELNANGVLLKGEILGANNLPNSEDDNAAGVFYRVLYAEGGDESSMFRCKTPIYKSEVAYDLEFPRWEADKKFRFEMVLPGDESLEESDFTDHGDVIVAVYKSRSNGGSDFVGQVCIQLQDFIRVGSVGRARPNSHCRLLKGCFPLISRHGDIVGDGLADVDIDISLEWRLVDKPLIKSSSRSAIEDITARNKQHAGKGGSVKGSDKKSRKGKTGAQGGKNSSSAMSSLKASRRSRQQSFLDAQNDKMRARLERAGPKQMKRPVISGQKESDNTTISEIYKPVAQAASERKKASVRKDKCSKPVDHKRTKLSSYSKPLDPSMSHDELVMEFEALRKLVGESQLEVKTLRNMDSKLKAQVTKNESVTARMKKIELDNRKKTDLGSNARGNGEVEQKESDSFYSVKNILLRAGIEDDEDQLSDELLRERLAEHSILQETRTACLERIEKASNLHTRDEAELKKCKQDIEQKHRELEARASKIDTPKADWNLHILNKESKITSLKTEVSELKMLCKLNLDPDLSKSIDEVANTTARIDFLESSLLQKSDELDGVRFDTDNWKERLTALQVVEGSDLSLASHLRQSITMIRNAVNRLQRQKKLMRIRSETDAVELEVLRHDLNQKQSDC